MTSIVMNGSTKKKKKLTGNWPRVRFFVTLLIFVLIGSNFIAGTTCSISVGSISFECPLGVVQVLAATGKILPTMLVGGLLGFGLIVLFGRAFCSWICPGRLIFNGTKKSKPLSPQAKKWLHGIMFGGTVGLSFVCHNPLFCIICPAGVVCRGAIAAGTGGSLLPAIGWMGTLVGVEWVSQRSWCRDLCPLGAAISFLSRFNPF